MSDYISKKQVYKILTDLMTESGKEAKVMLSDAKAQVYDEDGADVVEGVACKECRFRDVCQQEIKMLGPGIVYECSFKIEGCSLGERIVRTNECK